MSVETSLIRSHRAADAGRGVVALAGIVALVVGAPAVLVGWVGWPLPSAVPPLSEVTQALRDTYIPDEFLLEALALVCWLVWVELVASLLVEAVAYARGRKAAALPLAGGLQRAAARLVAAVALLGTVVAVRGAPGTGARSAPPLGPVGVPAVSLVSGAGDLGYAAGPAAPVAGRADTTREGGGEGDEVEHGPVLAAYEVQRRDTLWDVAERHLGDPLRWQEIFQLNRGCPQADGGCLADPDVIHVGWQLRLPADAVGLAPAPAPVPPPPWPGTAAGDAPVATTSASPAGAGGMVLVDGGGATVGRGVGAADVVLVAESTSPTPAAADGAAADGAAADGMVLLPDDHGDRHDNADAD